MNSKKICVIGNGSFGTTLAKMCAENALRHMVLHPTVMLHVFHVEETTFNQTHENEKYLPGVKLGGNLVATKSYKEACEDADLIVICVPHQFLGSHLKQMKPWVKKAAKVISGCKGMLELGSDGEIILAHQMIQQTLGVQCAVLSGANIARQIALEEHAETTIGCHSHEDAIIWKKVFATPYFGVNTVVGRTAAIELCGSLKNVVALAAGFVDGLELGSNTKSAIIRLGMKEMYSFTKKLVDPGVSFDLYMESCAFADLMTTCLEGRNRKCAEEFARTQKPWKKIEEELLKGQKLQGTLTTNEVKMILQHHHMMNNEFPLFQKVYEISFENEPPRNILHVIQKANLREFTQKEL